MHLRPCVCVFLFKTLGVMETIYLCVEKPHTGYKRASLGNVWKNGEPQANNWLATRKCALKRGDLAIEDGIITWWVASGLGEALTLKLSLTLQSLPGRRGTEANPLGEVVAEFCSAQVCTADALCLGAGCGLFPGCFPVAPRPGLSGGWLLSDMSSSTRMWEILQIHLCGTQGLCCSGSAAGTGVLLPEPAQAWLQRGNQLWVNSQQMQVPVLESEQKETPPPHSHLSGDTDGMEREQRGALCGSLHPPEH